MNQIIETTSAQIKHLAFVNLEQMKKKSVPIFFLNCFVFLFNLLISFNGFKEIAHTQKKEFFVQFPIRSKNIEVNLTRKP